MSSNRPILARDAATEACVKCERYYEDRLYEHEKREVLANADHNRLCYALRPFADLYDDCLNGKSDNHPVFALNDNAITVGDLRRAMSALGD